MKVLVINCGSSSLKYQLIDSKTEKPLASGLCERIGIDGRLVHKPIAKGLDKVTIEAEMKSPRLTSVKLYQESPLYSRNSLIRSQKVFHSIAESPTSPPDTILLHHSQSHGLSGKVVTVLPVAMNGPTPSSFTPR